MESLEARLAELTRFVELKFANMEKKFSTLESQIKSQTTTHKTADSQPLGSQLARKVTAIAGLKEALISEHRRTRYAWTLLLCLGIGATAFYLYQTTDEYLKSPTATTVTLSTDSQHHFLPLLICPPAWFDTEKASNLGLSMDAFKYSLSYLSQKFQFGIVNASRAKDDFLSVYASHNFESLLDYYSYIAPDIEPDKILGTSAAAYSCRGCAIHSKPEKTILHRDVCYVFRLKPLEKAFGVYSDVRSLSIKFTDRTSGMVPFSPDWSLYFKHFEDSFLSIHPIVNVRVFRRNTVKFDVRQLEVLNKPNAPCKEAANRSIYSFSRCMAVCHNEIYRNLFNCGLIWLSSPSSKLSPMELCNYADKPQHKNHTLAEFLALEDNIRVDADAADRCIKRCPRRCNRSIFGTRLQMKTSLTDVDAERFADVESGNVSYIEIILMHAAVYQGGITSFTEVNTYSFTQLVNNIGGTLGLFVGATVMTFAQLILFGVDQLFRKLRLSNTTTPNCEMTVRDCRINGGK